VSNESQQDQQRKKMGCPLKFDEDFRKTALERLKECRYIIGLAQELGISRSQLYRIQRDALGRKPEPKPEGWLKEKADERLRRRIADLERLVARQALELDFSKVPCCASREIAGSRGSIPASRLRANPAR
jgi:AraC-like DNA-binding protein